MTGMTGMDRGALDAYLGEFLQVHLYRDYCPNGLQVEGRAQIRHIVSGVTASAALIGAAIEAGADALLVHHGYFWRGEDARITGLRRRRIGSLIGHDLNLFAYHLPLDAHPEVGNNAMLGRRLGLDITARGGENNLVAMAAAPEGQTLDGFAAGVSSRLGRPPLVVGEGGRVLRRIAWCTGGAQGYFEQAIAMGADVYLSGEISEQTVHLARESGVAYIAAGHHATERYGVQALGEHLARRFGLLHSHIDIDNPA